MGGLLPLLHLLVLLHLPMGQGGLLYGQEGHVIARAVEEELW